MKEELKSMFIILAIYGIIVVPVWFFLSGAVAIPFLIAFQIICCLSCLSYVIKVLQQVTANNEKKKAERIKGYTYEDILRHMNKNRVN